MRRKNSASCESELHGRKFILLAMQLTGQEVDAVYPFVSYNMCTTFCQMDAICRNGIISYFPGHLI